MKTTVTEAPSSFGPRGAPPPPRLRVIFTPGYRLDAATLDHFLAPGVTVLGREPGEGAGLALPADRNASRVHARIEVAADSSARVIDAGSRNGTLVNGQRVAGSRVLADGDLVRIGNSFIIFRRGAAPKGDAYIPELVGVSPAACELRHQIARLAPERGAVLILGETGTGKEVAAGALHRLSKRSGTRVAVNCSLVPVDLAESQFFGHAKGAFTGATAHSGYFRAAHGGTLFLDGIGDIPLALQPKLLRALEDHAVMPVGTSETVACDVRVVAATNRDLLAAVEARLFREDLYARLTDFVLRLPPLRERIEDVLLLLGHAGDGGLELQPDVVDLLLAYRWPRNVREVHKIAGHLRLFGPDEALRERLTPASPIAAAAPVMPIDAEEDKPRRPPPSREELMALMVRHEGVIQEVAEALGCSRRQVGRWLDHHGLDRQHYRS